VQLTLGQADLSPVERWGPISARHLATRVSEQM